MEASPGLTYDIYDRLNFFPIVKSLPVHFVPSALFFYFHLVLPHRPHLHLCDHRYLLCSSLGLTDQSAAPAIYTFLCNLVTTTPIVSSRLTQSLRPRQVELDQLIEQVNLSHAASTVPCIHLCLHWQHMQSMLRRSLFLWGFELVSCVFFFSSVCFTHPPYVPLPNAMLMRPHPVEDSGCGR